MPTSPSFLARLLPAFLALLLVVPGSAHAGQGRGRGQAPPPGGQGNGPVRDVPPSSQDVPGGTASIVGTVVVLGTGAPARHARVSLSGDTVRGRSVTTDDQGRYAFAALPAGRFTLSASKPGHLNVSYGQRVPGSGRPGTPIQLEDGQRLTITLQIPRGGVISGTVLDEHGEAVPGNPGSSPALYDRRAASARSSSRVTTRPTTGACTASTDSRRATTSSPRRHGSAARGGAVAERLQEAAAALGPQAAAAGEQAAATLLNRMAVAEGQGGPDDQTAGYAPVFYPGTTIAGSATSVPLGIGEERLGVDFQLQLVAMARVEGTVVYPAGQQPGGVQIQLVNVGDDVPGIGDSSARADSEGRFRFSNVAPGQYTLVARTAGFGGPIGPMVGAALGRAGGPGGTAAGGGPLGRGGDFRGADVPRLWGTTEISVDGRNLSNVVLTLQPGFTVSGRVEFRGATPQPQDPTRLRVTLNPADVSAAGRQLTTAASGRIDENGRFTIDGVVPGRYRMVSGGPGGWVLESAVIAGQDALDMPVEIRSSQNLNNGAITFTDQQTSVTGVASNARGQAVSDYTLVVYAADPRYWMPQSRRIRSIRPATDGTFSVGGLPPGDYRVAPVLDPEPGSWFDPSFLQQLDGVAERFSLTEGEKKVQNVRVGGA